MAKKLEQAARDEMQNAVAYSCRHQIRVPVPSLGKTCLLDITYTHGTPGRFCINAANSPTEILQPQYAHREYINFTEGRKYLETIFTDEVIRVLEENTKDEEIRRNLRRKKKA